MLIANPRAQRSAYPSDLQAIMSVERAQESRRWLSSWQGIARQATPLRDLPGLAQQLGIASFSLKDESLRSSLGSFKALGAPVALVRQILRLHPGLDPAAILSGRYADQLQGYTVISATDGNHG
ncbi:MAG: pyridoxal-phosphate dependent enzyme, partial [Comamonas sp.]|nr:pyridoxal-phosphate dependent enzyme [Comamonas sp.]